MREYGIKVLTRISLQSNTYLGMINSKQLQQRMILQCYFTMWLYTSCGYTHIKILLNEKQNPVVMSEMSYKSSHYSGTH